MSINNKVVFLLPALIYISALIIFACICLHYIETFEDDAYISLRYAYNFLNGDGLTWNLGEKIEGYTNFLFIMLVAGLGFLGIDLEVAARVINFLSFSGIIACLYLYMKANIDNSLKLSPVIVATVLSVVISSAILIIWCLEGLETPLFSFLVITGICLTSQFIDNNQQKSLVLAALFFSLATLTRPDGLIYFICATGFLVLLHFKDKKSIKPILLFIAAYSFVIAPYLLWKISYFGDYLPNTYYAKLYGVGLLKRIELGVTYIAQYLLLPPFLLIMTIAFATSCISNKYVNKAFLYVLLNALIIVTYVIYIGGDYMFNYRFMVPYVPIAALIIFHTMNTYLSHGHQKRLVLLAIVIFFAILLQSFIWLNSDQERVAGGPVTRGHVIAPYIKEKWLKGSVIALNTAGTIPYLAPDNYYIDMLGILDSHIAKTQPSTNFPLDVQGHMKGDGKYVLSKKPDYIIFGVLPGVSVEKNDLNKDSLFISGRKIIELDDFYNNYQKETIRLEVPKNIGEWRYDPETKDGTITFTFYKKRYF